MHLPQFNYLAPQTTDELSQLLSQYKGKARILAGGTDLLVLMKNRLLRPEYVVDISGLEQLRGITRNNGQGVTIGAGTKLEVVERSDLIKQQYLSLHQAMTAIGSAQVRATASLGGNSCNASPAADSPPALIVLGAKVVLVSQQGRREMALEDFITGPREIALNDDEYLESIIIPPPWPNSANRFYALGKRDGMECDLVNLAVNLALDPKAGTISQVAIAMGAVGPKPLRARQAEKVLQGQKPEEALIEKAAQAAVADTQAMDDFRACANYRQEAIRTLTGRLLRETLNAIG